VPLYLSPLPARPAAAMAVMFATRLLAHRASALTVVLAAHTLADWAHTVFVVLPASLSAHRTDAVVAVISTELICIRHGIILMSPGEWAIDRRNVETGWIQSLKHQESSALPAFFNFSHRAHCAAAIFLRAAADIVSFTGVLLVSFSVAGLDSCRAFAQRGGYSQEIHQLKRGRSATLECSNPYPAKVFTAFANEARLPDRKNRLLFFDRAGRNEYGHQSRHFQKAR
jgi:hypothetical protein